MPPDQSPASPPPAADAPAPGGRVESAQPLAQPLSEPSAALGGRGASGAAAALLALEAATNEGRDVCFYDGACGLCRTGRDALRRLDWLGRLAFVDLLALPETHLPVPIDTALRGMPMRTRDGQVLVGFEAVRRALRQTPAGFVPGWLMYLPGLAWAGRRVYAAVAARRRRTVDRHGTTCVLGPRPARGPGPTPDGVGEAAR